MIVNSKILIVDKQFSTYDPSCPTSFLREDFSGNKQEHWTFVCTFMTLNSTLFDWIHSVVFNEFVYIFDAYGNAFGFFFLTILKFIYMIAVLNSFQVYMMLFLMFLCFLLCTGNVCFEMRTSVRTEESICRLYLEQLYKINKFRWKNVDRFNNS